MEKLVRDELLIVGIIDFNENDQKCPKYSK